MAFRTTVNNFTRGEFDPRFLAMVDYESYHKGCRAFKNVVCIPQGGCSRRFGSTYSDVVVDRAGANAPITDISQVRIFGYEYGVDEKYDIIIRPDSTANVNIAFDIYMGDVLVDTVYPPINTYTTAQIRDIRWAALTDRIVLFHPNVQMHKLVRVAFNNWTCSIITPVFYPTFDYTAYDDPATPYYAAGQTYTPTAAALGAACTVARSAGTSTPFTDNHVGGLLYINGGVVRVTSIASNISATGYIIAALTGTAASPGSDCLFTEKGWGNGSNVVVTGVARGWPEHGVVFQGRLYVGGWKSQPGRASASVVNSLFNWDDFDDDASAGFSFEVGTDGNDSIQDLMGYKSLVALGFKGPSASSVLLDGPLTSSNIYVNSQGKDRAARIDGHIVNNQVLYVSNNFESVYSMYLSQPDSGYDTFNISSLSAHLMTEIRWGDVYDPLDRDGIYFVVINEDGTFPVLLLKTEEKILAWSDNFTVGSYIDIAASGDESKVLVKRQISTATILGDPDTVYRVDETFNAFTDVTAPVIAGTNTTFFSTDDEYLVIGNEIQFTALHVEFSTPASTDCDLTFEYLDGNGNWASFSPTDTTVGFTLDGNITWSYTDVNAWKSQDLNNVVRKYWVRIRRTANTLVTAPVVDTMFMNTASRIYRESLTFESYMDCTVSSTSNSSGDVTGLAALAGQKVFIYADGFPAGSFIVTDTGTLALGSAYADAVILAGLDYRPSIIPMPLTAFMPDGYNTYAKQHILEAYIDYYQSLGITANGQQVVPEGDGAFLAVTTPVPVTQFFEIPVHKGWDPRQEIEISQSYPAPMTLLGIGLTAEIT